MNAISHPAPPRPRRSRWIPWVFVGGMLLVTAVNGVLIYASATTFTGLTTGQSFDKGRAYNHVLEEAARQKALGWQAGITVAQGGLHLAATGRDGVPLPAGVTLSGVLRRPLTGEERMLDFAALGGGRWRASLADMQAGLWEARLTLRGANEARLMLRERVVLP
ncbi:FixH family protein [Teichococcus oryzae]|uniref:FixH family protein n=1 Tax=Teichococcus oryzae TaxID=1608942 RepID=A0A5B2THM9_9PROT|nr:FixH family protein [Pseudoroseomonas oryzae]KAA2213996.1 FixH family protein [Pseudoroseomonas oryzae]